MKSCIAMIITVNHLITSRVCLARQALANSPTYLIAANQMRDFL